MILDFSFTCCCFTFLLCWIVWSEINSVFIELNFYICLTKHFDLFELYIFVSSLQATPNCFLGMLWVNKQQATSNMQQPTTINQQPTTNNQQPATSNQQPTTSNQQPASNKQPATNNHHQQQPRGDGGREAFTISLSCLFLYGPAGGICCARKI